MSCEDVYTDHMEEELKIKLHMKLVCKYTSLPIARLDYMHETTLPLEQNNRCYPQNVKRHLLSKDKIQKRGRL